jgi:GNAT superfamily N-acetyltransferase
MEIRRLGEEEVELLEAALRDLLPPEDLPRGPASRPHLTRALADRACYFPEHRRRGIATGLLEVLKQCCRADGVTRIWVGTSLENRAAQRTFEATGARNVSETYVEYIYDLNDRAH